jgi:branched-chain amino acid transport system permease protein
LLTIWQIAVIHFAIYFGQYFIVATTLNFQYGNAGIPNMSINLSVACGAYVITSVVTRICMWLLGMVGVAFKPNWVYDNPYNVSVISDFLETRPLLGFSLFMLSLALALVFGNLLGWVLASISGKMRATTLMVLLYVVAQAGDVIVVNESWIAGGSHGAFIPNFLSWYPGDDFLIVAVTTLLVGLVCYLVVRAIQNSPFGRLARAVRENEWTVLSMGKDVARFRRGVMAFSSGMLAVTGVLLALYYRFVEHRMFDQLSYTIWPWLMITMGGIGNNAGSVVGVIVCVGILKTISTFNLFYGGVIASSGMAGLFLTFEEMALSVILLAFLIYKPNGLIPEKRLHIKGIDYIRYLRKNPSPA